MKYDFTTIMDRHGMDAIAVDGLSEDGQGSPAKPKEGFDIIPMWVADMNFATVPTVQEAIAERVKHPAFGYFDPREEYFQEIIDWQTKKWIPGTEIILCGYTGLEGTLRLVDEAEADLRTRFTPSFIEKTKRCKEALILPEQVLQLPEEAKSRQCGDGGVLCGLWELAEAEKIGFEIDFSKLALKQETVEICEFFQLNPYLLTSAGSYLVLTEHGEETLESLKNAGVPAVRIGFVKEQNARTLVNGEETRYLDRPAPDELSRWWKERKESEEQEDRRGDNYVKHCTL